MTDPVRQGFICPFCMDDLGDFPRLQAHVETFHAEATNDAADIADAVMSNVKGILDKAKRSIRKFDVRVNSVDLAQVNIGVSSSVADLANYASSVTERVQEKARPPRPPPAVRPPPVRAEIGVTRSHKELFMDERESSVNDSAVRTNMLIIRLDRLINECPADLSKRKDFEREVVPWNDDSESIHCRSCAVKFGLTKRKHHCRLCGRVMCHQCSRFLSFLSARKLTNPALAAQMTEATESNGSRAGDVSPSASRRILELTQRTTDKMKMMFEGAVNKIGNSTGSSDGSEVSLGSLLQQDASECLRVCMSCLNELHRREEMMEQRVPPVIAEQYATLDQLIHDVSTMAPSYQRMANSVNNGETMYTLKSAEEMRLRVIQKQKEIDFLSKSIVAVADSENCGLKEAQLRKNIRLSTLTILQGVVSNLVNLPTEEEYKKLVETHKQQIAKQVEEARLRNLALPSGPVKKTVMANAASTSQRTRSASPSARIHERKTVEEGWTPHQTTSYNPFLEDEGRMHPLFEQRDIIKGYLSQAAAAGKLAEVDMLERNLKDLEDEMRNLGLEP